jgi:two-component sensor histidine kinase
LGAGKSFRICLAVEEIAGNIVEHGFTGKKENILLIFGWHWKKMEAGACHCVTMG